MANLLGEMTLLPAKTITGAVTGFVTETFRFNPAFPKVITAEAFFTYGSGGTTAKAWLQTSLDGGATWIDIMCFAFLLASANKVASVNNFVTTTNVVTPADGALADNTTQVGVIGSLLRVKVTTTGTYAGGTTLTIQAKLR